MAFHFPYHQWFLQVPKLGIQMWEGKKATYLNLLFSLFKSWNEGQVLWSCWGHLLTVYLFLVAIVVWGLSVWVYPQNRQEYSKSEVKGGRGSFGLASLALLAAIPNYLWFPKCSMLFHSSVHLHIVPYSWNMLCPPGLVEKANYYLFYEALHASMICFLSLTLRTHILLFIYMSAPPHQTIGSSRFWESDRNYRFSTEKMHICSHIQYFSGL